MNKKQILISEEIKQINEKLLQGKASILVDMKFYYINFYIKIFRRASKLSENTLIKTFYSDITLKFVLFKQTYLEILKANSERHRQLKEIKFKDFEKITEREEEVLVSLLLSGNFEAVLTHFFNLLSREIEETFKETFVVFNFVRIGLVTAINEARIYFNIVKPSYVYEFQGKKYYFFSKEKKHIKIFNSIINSGVFVENEEKDNKKR